MPKLDPVTSENINVCIGSCRKRLTVVAGYDEDGDAIRIWPDIVIVGLLDEIERGRQALKNERHEL